jgi:hypothetical protein
MLWVRSTPEGTYSWRTRISGYAGSAALVVGLTACGDGALDVTATLDEACAEARETFADAPTPANANSEVAFVEGAQEAAQTVVDVIDELSQQVDDRTLADMSWQLNNFPGSADGGELLGVAHEASAAIIRLNGFAEALSVSECEAPTWRPADWHAMADRLEEARSEEDFHADLNRLCAETFPNPTQLAQGTPLLTALVGGSDDPSEDVVATLLSRLTSLNNRPAEARRFLRDFSDALPELSPPESLESDYFALLAAFIHVDAVVPNVIPNDPSAQFRRRVDPAFTELEAAWDDLGITCSL